MENEQMSYVYGDIELLVRNWNKSIHSIGDLAEVIRDTHDVAQTFAVKAINHMQTCNRLIDLPRQQWIKAFGDESANAIERLIVELHKGSDNKVREKADGNQNTTRKSLFQIIIQFFKKLS